MESDSSLRERLIDVGVELVMTGGSASLGLREIARRAGVSHGAPRRYFPTHHALLSAIARRGFADLAARVGAATEGATSARGRLRTTARVYLEYALEHRGMFELMFRHDLLDSEKHDAPDGPRLRESTLPLFRLIVELVAQCRADAGPPPAVTAAALWSNVHGIAQLWGWGSLQLVLDTAPGDDPLERLLTATLDAHLGPAR
ncbi:TetR/AcrR family transcriptional regulator [Sphaerisporangium fuscum]|uniref:TetR/AcrR family transcriptional regulator n=1 Tax=Sphaerisporangium fuscum TaxID=2835868 RepID=UPI001BDD4B9C|nr:TetR/AcrR family transcriptional regulator [Sphaerisporangium fuscum]